MRRQTSTHLIINGSSVILLMFDFSFTKCHTSEVLDECLLRPENRTAGLISREDINKTYIDDVVNSDLPLDCLWVIEVKPGWGVRNDSLLFISLPLLLYYYFMLTFYNTFDVFYMHLVKIATSLLFFHLQYFLGTYWSVCACVFFSSCLLYSCCTFLRFDRISSGFLLIIYFRLSFCLLFTSHFYRSCCITQSSICKRKTIATAIFLTLSEIIQMFRNRK